jgi:hypothetical protein
MSRKIVKQQRFRGIGVVIKGERKGTQGKMGMGAVLEKTNGSHEV